MEVLPSDAWRQFVREIVQNGSNAHQAAQAVGFVSTSQGSRLAHDPRVQAAILEEGLKLVRTDGVKALHVLRKIAFDDQADNRDRLKACEMILSRGGFAAVTQHQIDVVHRTDDQLKRELLAMAEELGMDRAAKAQLVGGSVTDAEFEEVPAHVDPLSDIAPTREPAGAKIADIDAADRRARQRRTYHMTPEELKSLKAQQREEKSARAKMEYEAAQRGRAGLEDLLPEAPIADEAGEVSSFNPTEEYPDNE